MLYSCVMMLPAIGPIGLTTWTTWHACWHPDMLTRVKTELRTWQLLPVVIKHSNSVAILEKRSKTLTKHATHLTRHEPCRKPGPEFQPPTSATLGRTNDGLREMKKGTRSQQGRRAQPTLYLVPPER